jgi:hypothetical protein
MGYKEPTDLNLEYLSGEKHFAPDSHIIFMFENEAIIRVGAERGLLREVEDGR